MSELDLETIGKTQVTLGKVIQKPVLTEKLLKRPPFKFLHDIVVNVSPFHSFSSTKHTLLHSYLSLDQISWPENRI